MTKWIKIKCLETKNRKYLKANKMIPSKEKTEDIVLLRLDAIGDFILWLDSAKEYRGLYPETRIVLVCNACNKVIAEKLGMFDEIIPVSMNRFLVEDNYKKEVEAIFKTSHYGVLIQTEFSRTIEMDVLAAMIPATEKIAMEADESKNNLSRYIVRNSTKKLADGIYSRLIVADREWKMELIRNADFIRALGKPNFRAGVFRLPLMERQTDFPKTKYFIIFPGASSQKKQWAPENYAHVIQSVFKNTEYCGIICGAESERLIGEKVMEKVGTIRDDRLINKAGKTTLLELIEYIRNAVFVITNDTSGVHFATSTDTPSVCIAGEQNKGRFLPYQLEKAKENEYLPVICSAEMKCARCTYTKRSWRCLWNIIIKRHFLCIEKVKVSSVERAVQKIKEDFS